VRRFALLPVLWLVPILCAGCHAAGPVLAPAVQAPAAQTPAASCAHPGSIDEAFQCARRDPNALRALFLAMPKGGDLHHHLTGAVYAEVLIQQASYAGLCVDLAKDATGTPKYAFQPCASPPAGGPQSAGAPPITAPTAGCKACADSSACTGTSVPACCLCASSSLYDATVNALSMRGLPWGTLDAHDHFFAIFSKLGPAAANGAALLAQMRQQASRENVLYLETMSSAIKPAGAELDAAKAQFAGSVEGGGSPGAAFCARLMAGPLAPGTPRDIDAGGRAVLAAVDALAQRTAAAMAAEIEQSDALLGCGTDPHAPGCEVTVRRQIEMHRTLPPAVVCQEALLGFAAAHADRRHIVGINIVAAEDAYVPRVDYTAHMHLIGNLGRIYPDVGRSLHAGELAEGLVPPNDLRFHVRDAVCTAGAQRIGHGVDVTWEAGSAALLAEMAGRRHDPACAAHPADPAGPVAVEINLVSNAQLLGVQGAAHPFPLYRAAGVPVVLATDDPGIMRTSLTEQYRWAGEEYPQLRYADFRTIDRNGLEYGFLTGASIWQDPGVYRQPVAACRAAGGALGVLDVERCAAWATGQGDKARLEVELERRLYAFEASYRP